MPREKPRIPYLSEVVVESASGRRQERISDLGLGGCFIDSIATVMEGEAVNFDLLMPNGNMLKFTGRVTYLLHGVGYGVRFTDLSDEQKTFLEEIVGELTNI